MRRSFLEQAARLTPRRVLAVVSLTCLGLLGLGVSTSRRAVSRAWAPCPPPGEGDPPPGSRARLDPGQGELPAPGSPLCFDEKVIRELRAKAVSYPVRVEGLPPFVLRFGPADLSSVGASPWEERRTLSLIDPSGRAWPIWHGLAAPGAHPCAGVGGLVGQPLPLEGSRGRAAIVLWNASDVDDGWRSYGNELLVLYDPLTRTFAFLMGCGRPDATRIDHLQGRWRIRWGLDHVPMVGVDFNAFGQGPHFFNAVEGPETCRVFLATLGPAGWSLEGTPDWVYVARGASSEAASPGRALQVGMEERTWWVERVHAKGGTVLGLANADRFNPEGGFSPTRVAKGTRVPFQWAREVFTFQGGALDKRPLRPAQAEALVRAGGWTVLLNDNYREDPNGADVAGNPVHYVELLVKNETGFAHNTPSPAP